MKWFTPTPDAELVDKMPRSLCHAAVLSGHGRAFHLRTAMLRSRWTSGRYSATPSSGNIAVEGGKWKNRRR